MDRDVLLVCGAAGSGKTTFARSCGLPVFDRDDARWRSDKHFNAALASLGRTAGARAVVIREGATRNARKAAVRLVGATRVVVLDTPVDECVRRILLRNRPNPPLRQQVAACRSWFERFEPDVYPPELSW